MTGQGEKVSGCSSAVDRAKSWLTGGRLWCKTCLEAAGIMQELVSREAQWAEKLAAAEARIRELEERTVTQAAEVLASMENRREADKRIRSLEAQVTGFDCRFAGKWAETSGSHCPAERPCDRCAAESEVRMWEGINAKLIDRAETAEAKLAEAVGDMCPSCRLRWDLSRLDEKERGE